MRSPVRTRLAPPKYACVKLLWCQQIKRESSMRTRISLSSLKACFGIPVFALFILLMNIRFGLILGIHQSLLWWSFFILCTPVTKGGIFIDGIRSLGKKKRWYYSEIVVWLVAIILNIISLHFFTYTYYLTGVSHLLLHILLYPWPYWIILLTGIISMVNDTILYRDEQQKITAFHIIIGWLMRFGCISTFIFIAYPLIVTMLNIYGLPFIRS